MKLEKVESTLPTSVTQDMVRDWKKEHGELQLIAIEDAEGKVFKAVAKKKISNRTASLAMPWIDKNIFKYSEILVNAQWLGGDEIIKTTPGLVIKLATELSSNLSTGEATSENL